MKSTLFVILQFLLIATIALYAGVVGGVAQNALMTTGLILGLWAIVTMKFKVNVLPDVRENQKLFISGPYKFIRHPMYTAVLLVTFSWILNRPDFVSIGLWLLLLVDLVLKLKYEEKLLSRKFKGYIAYTRKTKRLIPLVY